MFNTPEFINLMNVTLKRTPNKRDALSKICCSARTLLRWADNKSEENVNSLKEILPKLAEQGLCDIILDHKFVGPDRESRSKVLGIEIR